MSSPASPGAAPFVGRNIVTTTARTAAGLFTCVNVGLANDVLPPLVCTPSLFATPVDQLKRKGRQEAGSPFTSWPSLSRYWTPSKNIASRSPMLPVAPALWTAALGPSVTQALHEEKFVRFAAAWRSTSQLLK